MLTACINLDIRIGFGWILFNVFGCVLIFSHILSIGIRFKFSVKYNAITAT